MRLAAALAAGFLLAARASLADPTMKRPPVLLRELGTQESGPRQLLCARGISTTPDGTLCVADSFGNRVVLCDRTGAFLRQWGDDRYNAGPVQLPAVTSVEPRAARLGGNRQRMTVRIL